MRKIILSIVLGVATYSGYAQIIFEPILPPPPAPQIVRPPFIGTYGGMVLPIDVDSDNDQDMLIIGYHSAKLYSNDGKGNYQLHTSFFPMGSPAAAWADVDGDGDQDLLMTGDNFSGDGLSYLYINDGKANFTAKRMLTGIDIPPVTGLKEGSIAFADVDGDDDPDVLITGLTSENIRITELYTNDGQGNFSKINGTPFSGVNRSSIAFADVDGDDDPDVLITGRTDGNTPVTELYTNDGQGSFSKVNGTPFDGVDLSSVAFADIDGDSDQDVLITGLDNTTQANTGLYINNGNGVFTKVGSTPFAAIYSSSVAFADVDGDTDPDALITGKDDSNQNITHLYKNNGGTFSQVSNTPFVEVYSASIAFADIDGDNDQDIINIGQSASVFNSYVANIYLNSGSGDFNKLTGTALVEVYRSAVAFADIDGDNDSDVLVTGQGDHGAVTRLYTNNGLGAFTEVSGTPFPDIYIGSVTFADIDGDTDQDVLLTGSKNGIRTALLYKNDGQGGFTVANSTALEGVYYSAAAFADVDGDGDQDVLITGNRSGTRTAALYTNDGQGVFSPVSNPPFTGVEGGAVTFADIDGDADQDVLITGVASGNTYIAKLYTNNGAGTFTEVTDAPFAGATYSSVALADIDNDMDIDVLITGTGKNGAYVTELYTNDGSGTFAEVDNTPFVATRYSSVSVADVDGDQHIDILIAGSTAQEGIISILYTNDGQGNFSRAADLLGVSEGAVSFTDLDGDDDPDLLITGESNSGPVALLYRNSSSCNVAPVADIDTLLTLTGGCQIAAPEAPTATNVCGGTITGTTDTSFPITDNSIKEVTWTYTNHRGISTTQVQQVQLADAQHPSWDTTYLPPLSGQCSIEKPPAPTATDNCDGKIVGIADVNFPITDPDVNEIIWTYQDSAGNFTVQTQQVDLTNQSPVPDVTTLPMLSGNCSIVAPAPPTATDDCDGEIIGTANVEFPITDPEIYDIIWTFVDKTGRTTTQRQSVQLTDIKLEINSDGNTLIASSYGADEKSFQWVNCNDQYSPIIGETSLTMVASESGSYAIEATLNGCTKRSACHEVVIPETEPILGVEENTFPGDVRLFPNPTRGIVTIELDQPYAQMQVTIRNLTGQVVQRQSQDYGQQITLELNQPKGVYLVTVVAGSHRAILRVVKQ